MVAATGPCHGVRLRATAPPGGRSAADGLAGGYADHAMAEAIFATLECPLLDHGQFRRPNEEARAVFEYIADRHDPHGEHSATGRGSPIEYERQQARASTSRKPETVHSIGESPMSRRATIALLGAGIMSPGVSNALGLGDIELESGLNQPLEAKIELRHVEELSSHDIVPTIPSKGVFDRVDSQWTVFVSKLDFEVVIPERGAPYIKVTSQEPVREPFLDLLLEVDWPSGRMYREYTILLDPPGLSQQAGTRIDKPQARTAQADDPEPGHRSGAIPSEPERQPEPTRSEAPRRADEAPSIPGTYDMSSGAADLWSIAQEVRPADSVSVQQTMLALQRKNPDAFVNGNINQLKSDRVLEVPDEQEIRSVSSRDAVQRVAEQNESWRDRMRTARADRSEALSRSEQAQERSSKDDADRSESGGTLKILAKGGDETRRIDQNAEDGGTIVSSSHAGQPQSEKLRSRVVELRDQLDNTEELLELQSAEITAFEAKLADINRRLKELQQQQRTSERMVTAATRDSSSGFAGETGGSSAASALSWLTGPLAWAGAGALAVIAVLAVLVRLRQTMPAREAKPAGIPEVAAKTPLDAGLPSEQAPTPSDPPVAGPGFAAPPPQAGTATGADDLDDWMPEVSTPAGTYEEVADALSEADIYIAYSRFDDAVNVLDSALEDEPENPAFHLKMMEVFVEQGDGEAFARQKAKLQQARDSQTMERVRDLENRLWGGSGASDGVSGSDGADPGVGDAAAEARFQDSGQAEMFEAGPVFELDLEISSDEEVPLAGEAPSRTAGGDEAGGDRGDSAPSLDDLQQELDAALAGSSPVPEQSGAESTPAPEEAQASDLPELEPIAEDHADTETDEFDLDLEPLDDEAPAELDMDADPDEPTPSLARTGPEGAPQLGEASEVSSPGTEDEAFDYPLGAASDDHARKLDLARSCMDSGADERARNILNEVLADGDADQRSQAQELLARLSQPPVEAAAGPQETPTLEAADSHGSAEQGSSPLAAAPAIEQPTIGDNGDAPVPDLDATWQPGTCESDIVGDADENATKLDRARAYIEMGDSEGASGILNEVVSEGTDEQQTQAKALLQLIS